MKKLLKIVSKYLKDIYSWFEDEEFEYDILDSNYNYGQGPISKEE